MTNKRTLQTYLKHTLILSLFAILVASCSGGGSSERRFDWQNGVYEDLSSFAGLCNSVAEHFWLRSLFNEFYLWFEDIVDADPNGFPNLFTHFHYLVTDEITPSGKPKDDFSFLANAQLLKQSLTKGKEVGYGMQLTIEEGSTDTVTVAFVLPTTPAAMDNIQRGDEIIQVGGFSFNTLEAAEAFDGLFPFLEGEIHDFLIDPIDGSPNRLVTLTAATISIPATQHYNVITQGSDTIGYLQFNSHTKASESELITAFRDFSTANINELILDMRYNSGGLLFIASQVSYMIAGATQTANKNFEVLKFNSRFFDENIIFESTGIDPATSFITPLPTLNLSRVVIISGPDTCSASESIINGLRGVGVDVALIGGTTCGKPFGFFSMNNCGIAYLPIIFQGFNHIGESDYADGFKPANSLDADATAVDEGCVADDDFTQPLGNVSEGLFAAALSFIDNGSCPPVTAISNSAFSTQASPNITTTSKISHPAVFRKNHGMRLLR